MTPPISNSLWSATALLAVAPAVLAQDASTGSGQASPAPKLVRIVVPFSTGASNDALARSIAPPLAKRLETTVIVENRPGAAGTVGADYVAKGPKDGSVLLLTSSTFLTASATQPRVPYDPVTAFAPVSILAQNPSILAVSAGTPFKTPAELIAAARSKPNWLTFGSAGVGSIAHMVTELIMSSAKIEMRHVPYKGASNAAIELAGGQIDMMMSSVTTLSPFARSGKVRLLAHTAKQPHPALPNLPPLINTVPGLVNETWTGVFAPAGVPARYVERLNREINEISISPDLRALMEPDAMLPAPTSPSAFHARVKQELATWKRVATSRKIVAE